MSFIPVVPCRRKSLRKRGRPSSRPRDNPTKSLDRPGECLYDAARIDRRASFFASKGRTRDVNDATERRGRSPWRVILAGTLLPVLFIAAGLLLAPPSGAETPAAPATATYVGAGTCATCHASETGLWEGSHHDLAMQHADESTVLGDFDDATFEKDGVTTSFFRRDGDFFVRTDSTNGSLQDFKVLFTFGVSPLQQYLIALPRQPAPGPHHRLGQPAGGRWRPALVPSLPGRGDPCRRRAALDRAAPELESDLRGLPLDQPRPQLRPRHRHVPHHLFRDQRRLRKLPRTGLGPCRLGGEVRRLGRRARHGPGRAA